MYVEESELEDTFYEWQDYAQQGVEGYKYWAV